MSEQQPSMEELRRVIREELDRDRRTLKETMDATISPISQHLYDIRRDYYGVDGNNGKRSEITKNTSYRHSAQWHFRSLWTAFLGSLVSGITWALWR